MKLLKDGSQFKTSPAAALDLGPSGPIEDSDRLVSTGS